MSEEKFLNLINTVNNGEWEDISHYFNDDINLFLSIIKRKGLLHLIDPFSDGVRDVQNSILFYLMQEDRKKWTRIICERAIDNDIVIKDDGYYLYLRDLSELSVLFYEKGRGASPKNIADGVLGEDYKEFLQFDYKYFDIENDILDNLTKENLIQLKQHIFVKLEGKTVDAYTDVLEEYQNEEGNVIIDKDNWDSISDDLSTLAFLIKQSDIDSDLFNLYSNCQNSSFNDEIYNEVWDELSTFFEGRPQHLTKLNKVNNKIHYSLLKIRDVSSIIMDFLSENKDDSWGNTLEYNGSLMFVLKECMSQGVYDELNFRVPDYPDYGYYIKCLNESISDIY